MKIFVIAIIMWWADPTARPPTDSVEIHTYNGEPLYFKTRDECFDWIGSDLENIKAFGHSRFPTAQAVGEILCVETQDKRI